MVIKMKTEVSMKRLILCMVLIAAASAVFAGGTKESAEAAAAKPKVEVWVHQHQPLVDFLGVKAKSYMAENNDAEIEIVAVVPSELRNKVLIAASSGDSPAVYDLFSGEFPDLVNKGLAAKVDWKSMGYASRKDFEDFWFASAINEAKAPDGEYYALPFLGNPWALFLNKAHFMEAGLDPVADAPKTWEELTTVAKKLTKYDGNKIVRMGFDLPWRQGGNWWDLYWLPIVRQLGGDVLSKDGKTAVFNDDAGVKALTVFYDMVHKHKILAAGIGIADNINTNQDFIDGRVSMWISGSWAIGTFKGKDIEKNYSVVPYPQVNPAKPVAMVSGWWWFVSPKTDKNVQEKAWKFMKYALDPVGQLNAAGLVMPSTELVKSPEWKAFPFFEAFGKTLESGTWPYMSPARSEIEAAIRTAMESSLINGVDPKTALDEAVKKANEALKEAYR
jgi:multiple sugar transport system substrate-binding protein